MSCSGLSHQGQVTLDFLAALLIREVRAFLQKRHVVLYR
jgi:hypothetical protein